MPESQYVFKVILDCSEAIAGSQNLEKKYELVAKNLQEEFTKATRVIGVSINKVTDTPIKIKGEDAIKTVETLGKVVKYADGTFKELINTTRTITGQMPVVSGTIKDVTNQFTKTGLETEKASKSHLNFSENLNRLADRALLTIPIWLALRTAMTAIGSAITSGLGDLVTESLLLDKVKKSLQGTTSEIATNFKTLKKETQSLALETGISNDKIINTFQKFASVGMNFALAMTATNAVTKLSVITQSDAVTSAEGFAHALSVLVDSGASIIDQQKQINDLIALTSELWKSGGFNVEEFTGSLEKFAVTVKSVNFTTSQTVALLATLSKSGLGSAGNLLRNSISQLLLNLDKLAGDLGVKVNPALDDTFSILMKVLEQVNKLQTVNDLKGLTTAKEAMKDIFGGTRSAVPVAALSSLYDALKKNLDLIPDFANFNKSFEDSEKKLGNLVARFHTINSEISKSFMTGVTGADNYEQALDKVNKVLEEIHKHSEEVGKAIYNMFTGRDVATSILTMPWDIKVDTENTKSKIKEQIVKALQGSLSKQELIPLFNQLIKFQTMNIDIGLGEASINEAIKRIKEQFLAKKEVTLEDGKQRSIIEDINKIENMVTENTIKKADFLKLEGYAKKELSALGLNEVEIERRILEFRTASGQFLEKDLVLQKELVNHLQSMEDIELRRSRARGLVDNQLDLLKLQGATNLQIVQQRIEIEKAFGLNQTKADLLRNELELNRAITLEKQNQNKISSDSVRIFEIAKKYDKETATGVANFLQGKFDLNQIKGMAYGEDILKALKEFFAANLEQAQAQEFFYGNVSNFPIPGQEKGTKYAYGGEGRNIPIQEKEAIKNIQPIDLKSIKLPDINTQVGQINIEIKKLFKEKDAGKQIIDSLLEAIRNDTRIESAINEKIDEF